MLLYSDYSGRNQIWFEISMEIIIIFTKCLPMSMCLLILLDIGYCIDLNQIPPPREVQDLIEFADWEGLGLVMLTPKILSRAQIQW